MEREAKLTLYYTPEHAKHNPTVHLEYGMRQHHPEEPRRLEAILARVKEEFFRSPESQKHIYPITREATDEEILKVHSKELLHFLERVWGEFNKEFGRKGEKVEFIPTTWQPICRHVNMNPTNVITQGGRYCFDTCTPVGEHSLSAAKTAVAAAVEAANKFSLERPSSIATPSPVTYVLARPPGHHATRGEYGGFCYFNHAAVAADLLRSRLLSLPSPSSGASIPRCPVAIFDIDYHHGNGTQDIFYSDPEVLYISLHASPDFDYPHFSGQEDERGEGAGLGFNFNFPLPPNASFDDHYLPALQQAMQLIKDKGCELIVVSLGLDAAKGDPVGSYSLEPANYATIGQMLRSLLLPLFVVQEGGYSNDVTLSTCVTSFLRSLTDPL